MTTQQTEKPDDAPQVSLVADVNSEPDVILRILVGLVNDSKEMKMEMGVTLHVSGIIVSGLLISYETYWEAFRVLVRENGSPDSQSFREAFADAFTAAITGKDLDGNAEPAPEGEETAQPASPMHIHLRDAVIWAPGVEPTLARTLWRGRLSHVSAWSIGTFGR
jgi:hypothetical protein